ncbi:hypothetical protein [Curtobacterium sp. MCPF17_046]|uniref:hypothetical protein n=1 Tax=Curtobacterium sp. MCPF17_046 TaxID=2175663 RepID=UPI0021AC7AE2|nr:hypothetical protein [Curtobacterium sp. MCPF17_046]
MMQQLMSAPAALAGLGVAVIVFGFAPGLVLALIVRLIPDLERRHELQAELYAVPYWKRPFWVAEQFEVALRVGLSPRIEWIWGRHVWHRSKLMSGLDQHREFPETFWVPDAEVKALIGPGDEVKLMWSVSRSPGERMWVEVTERHGSRLVGKLSNWPVCVYMNPVERVDFDIDDIIDYEFAEADTDLQDAKSSA